MNFLPDPLHPAVVHFPVVLILVGAVGAVIAIFWRRHHVPLFAGVFLALGAVGAWVAVQTGESDGGLLESLSPAAESLLEAHEDWAERTLLFAVIAAVAAVAAAALTRFPRTMRVTAFVAALMGLAASYAVYETGHRGGALVFRYRAGVQAQIAADVSTEAVAAELEGGGEKRSRDHD